MASRRRWTWVVVACLVGVLLAAMVARQLAIRDLRRLEASYIATRKPTACATQALTPGAFNNDQSKLGDTVKRLVTQALLETTAVRDRYARHRRVLPLPQLRSSEADIAVAMDAQVSLYTAMVNDPTHTEDLLHTLGRRNTRAEHHLARARRLLGAPETAAWKRRFICDHSV